MISADASSSLTGTVAKEMLRSRRMRARLVVLRRREMDRSYYAVRTVSVRGTVARSANASTGRATGRFARLESIVGVLDGRHLRDMYVSSKECR